MDLKIWILLAFATQSFAAVYAAQGSSSLSPTPNSNVAALGEALCDKRIEVVEEKLKDVVTLVSQNKQLCEFQIKALRDSGEQQKQICEHRINEANQQISNLQKSAQPRTNGRTASWHVASKLMPLFPGSKYYISKEKMSWHLASTFCKSNGMELASIETEAENNAILDVIGNEKPKESYWISGSDMGSEGTFYWTGTGMKISGFTYFERRQPDNFGGNEHCLQFWKPSTPTLAWNDHQCHLNFRFICEVNENEL
ncbi:hepatic lectin-like [Cloeon dipterum]|uniref:hepatic lectin-like n=1 Tax=Cloeon dipterum TaxID=197152 RepID=UPI003220A114